MISGFGITLRLVFILAAITNAGIAKTDTSFLAFCEDTYWHYMCFYGSYST